MRIAILHPSDAGSTAPFAGLDPECDPSRHLPGHDYTHVRVSKATAVRQVIDVARGRFDVAINLCDGAWEEDRPGIEVVQALERLDLAFTGAGSAFYDPTRQAMKMACHAAGVGVPAYVMASSTEDIARAAGSLRFPLIVKHPQGYSSVGMTRDSRVADAAALQGEAARTIAAYGAALIEEFIEGREFTVLVTEPRTGDTEPWVVQPVEYLFPEGESFKHFHLKWHDHAALRVQPVLDQTLDGALRSAASRTFSALDGSGYGRCDLRLNDAGAPFLLETNPNCGVFYPPGEYGSADHILDSDPAGHRGFLEHLLDCALRRRDRHRRCWEIRFDRSCGFGLYAARSIAAGETIEAYEERPHTLVSRGHVERTWHGLRREWFDRYAWPLTTGTHVIWSERPEDWRPLNHACDPNAWLDGLNLIARRAIPCGEAITLEYATFCGPEMEPFACQCGAADCRGTIRGTDYLLPAIRRQYAAHASDFIESAWHAASATPPEPTA